MSTHNNGEVREEMGTSVSVKWIGKDFMEKMRVGDGTQMVDCLPSVLKALGSIPSIP